MRGRSGRLVQRGGKGEVTVLGAVSSDRRKARCASVPVRQINVCVCVCVCVMHR